MSYTIIVKTGDVSGAGTDGTVRVRFMRNNSYLTDYFTLDISNYNDFERDDEDHYRADTSVELKDTDAIEVSLEPGGLGADWYLDWIRVIDDTTNNIWHVSAQQWFTAESAVRTSGTNSVNDPGSISGNVMTSHVYTLGPSRQPIDENPQSNNDSFTEIAGELFKGITKRF